MRDVENEDSTWCKISRGLIWNKTVSKENEKTICQSIIQTILYVAEVYPMRTRVRDEIRETKLYYMRRCLKLIRESKIQISLTKYGALQKR